MNVASLDIGSNTVLLLIAKVDETNKDFTPVKNLYQMPRLSKGLKNGCEISEENIARFYKVLENYKKVIEEYKCEVILANATNALRVASNSKKIIKEVKEKYNIEINVIPGEKEAEYSFLGASSTLEDSEERFVIDIGGGSSELIYGNNEEILFKKSHDTGAVSLTEKFIDNYPISDEVINKINGHLHEIFSEAENKIKKGIPAIAVAGTPTSLSAMNQNLETYQEQKIEGSILNIDDLNDLTKNLQKLSPNEILKRYGDVVKGREDVIFAGSLILLKIAQLMKVNQIIVSGRGIRYGAIVDYVNNL